MSLLSLDDAARRVLSCYAVTNAGYALISLGNRGGFSGAQLWRVEGKNQQCCLRAWPPDGPSLDRLSQIHDRMRQAVRAGLPFVPVLFTTNEGATAVDCAGRLWDLTAWLPGHATFRPRPTPDKLAAACTALALLHGAWAARISVSGPCPAIQRRIETAREWTALLQSGWRPVFASWEADPIHPWAERAWRLVQIHFHQVPLRIAPWIDRVVPLQPCLCDVWHDHLLFEGDTLTGIVDYGGVKLDHVSVDLARLLGSLVGDERQLRSLGLRAYARLRPLSSAEEGLIDVLDVTGTLLGMANWLKWLYRERRSYEDRAAVARRLAALVERVERW